MDVWRKRKTIRDCDQKILPKSLVVHRSVKKKKKREFITLRYFQKNLVAYRSVEEQIYNFKPHDKNASKKSLAHRSMEERNFNLSVLTESPVHKY